jgi:arsenical pump membrane protein
VTASGANAAVWVIAALATSGVIFRPWRVPEAVWAVAGAACLVLFGLLPPRDALHAIGRGTDVYLFLAGMMLLSELARREGFFDHLAALAVRLARGSSARLFLLVYAIGTVVTVFMSNDATAVVLTPAVYAVAKKAGAKPLPYLFACALVASAASFVLPISNPANLVVFGSHPPRLLDWLRQFGPASLAAIVATYAALRFVQRKALRGAVDAGTAASPLSASGRVAAAGIAVVALVLLAASALEAQLGSATLAASASVAAVILVMKREPPWPVLRHISWSVLWLVAGLFVLVQALEATGLVAELGALLRRASASSPAAAAVGAGAVVGVICNLVNNLPAGLLAGAVMIAAEASTVVRSAVVIGIDLGPNLSVTGSLATILWLIAIRREGETVSAWAFLQVGAVVMPVALVAALAALFI